MKSTVKKPEPLSDTELDLLECIARRNGGLSVSLVKHLNPESRQAFGDLLKRNLLKRSGETYLATPDAYLTLENGL